MKDGELKYHLLSSIFKDEGEKFSINLIIED